MSDETAPVHPFDSPGAPVELQPEPTPKRTGRTVAIVIAAVVGALILIAGGAAAAFFLLSGRGPQPEVAMPADTLGFVKIDLDPSAGQKINLARFVSSNLPKDAGFTVDPNSDNPFGDAIDSSGILDGSGVTWAEVDAWAGDRAAIAAIPGNGSEPIPIVIVRVDDEDAMKAFFAKQDATFAYSMVRDGYAVLAEDQGVVDRVTSSAAWLSDDADYQFDLAKLGGGQLVTGWADLSGLSSLSSIAGSVIDTSAASDVAATGQVIFGLSAEPSVLELRTVVTGASIDGHAVPALSVANGLGSLPEGTVAGLSLANPGEWLQEALKIAREQDQGFVVDDLTSATGLTEQQIIDLLSTTITAFVMKNPAGLAEMPLVGVRVVATDTSSETTWQDALDTAGMPVAMDTVKGPDGKSYIYMRSTDGADVLDQVKAAKGTLADSAAFAQVVPADATMSVFVDMAPVWDYLRQNDPTMNTYDGITAAGLAMTASGTDPSVVTATLRVAFSGN